MKSPDHKRSFIASMNKYNPYRITNITDSVYSRILRSRENPKDSHLQSAKNPKTIYLPPVKIEEGSSIGLNHGIIVESPKNLIENSKKIIKIDSFSAFSKSLDFSEIMYHGNSMKSTSKDATPVANQKKLYRNCLRRRSEIAQGNARTMSAMQQRDKPLRLPSKFKQNKSPWAFQVFKYL